MQGRSFLDLARDLVKGRTEVHRRGAAGRAYYALMLECREALFRWGFLLPPRDNVHTFVRLRFTYASDPDLKYIGFGLDKLGQIRNKADYDLSTLPAFLTDNSAMDAIQGAALRITLLDAIEADPARRAAAIAAIKKAFP